METPNSSRPTRRALLTALVLAAAPVRRPNVILLTADRWQVRATDAAGGGERPIPNLDRLAAESVRLSRTYSSCPDTEHSLKSILTGRFPHTFRLSTLEEKEGTLAGTLERAGYSVGSVEAGDSAIEFVRRNIPNDFLLTVSCRLGLFESGRSSLDRWIGRFLALLSDTGLAADSIVVFTAGQGNPSEPSGESGGGDPREESVRVPLLVRWPRRLAGKKPLDFVTSTVDIAPTILGLCGLSVPPAMQGLNLAELIAGGTGDPPESVYSEGRLRRSGEWRMVVRGLDKLVVNTKLEVTDLYNLGQDPYETANLAKDPAERRKRDELGALLRQWILRTGDRLARR